MNDESTSQVEVILAWKNWMIHAGLDEQRAGWFVNKGPAYCYYLMDCIYARV